MSDQDKVDKSSRARYIRRPSALFALSTTSLFVAVLAYTDWAQAQPPPANAPTNRYFRFGDPYPLGFPNVSRVGWDNVQKPPWNGERRHEWTVEWHPKSGPFEQVVAEVPTDPGYSGLGVYYDIRAGLVKEFKSSMAQAFAGYSKETNPESGETFWRARGVEFGFHKSTYWTSPELEDPDFPPAVQLYVTQTMATVALFCLLYFGSCAFLKDRHRFKRIS